MNLGNRPATGRVGDLPAVANPGRLFVQHRANNKIGPSVDIHRRRRPITDRTDSKDHLFAFGIAKLCHLRKHFNGPVAAIGKFDNLCPAFNTGGSDSLSRLKIRIIKYRHKPDFLHYRQSFQTCMLSHFNIL